MCLLRKHSILEEISKYPLVPLAYEEKVKNEEKVQTTNSWAGIERKELTFAINFSFFVKFIRVTLVNMTI